MNLDSSQLKPEVQHLVPQLKDQLKAIAKNFTFSNDGHMEFNQFKQVLKLYESTVNIAFKEEHDIL